MLNPAAMVASMLTFVVTLTLLLSLALTIGGAVESQVPSAEISYTSFKINIVYSLYFLVLSGYLILYFLSYAMFANKLRATANCAIWSALFVLSFVFFVTLRGGDYSYWEFKLLALGVLSVIVAGALSESVKLLLVKSKF